MRQKIKQAIAVTSGTLLQWYDFSLFGYLAPVIAVLYFPSENQTASLLYTYGVFAISYVLTPLGAAFFGYIGDNYGRKKALTLSILAMAIPTSLIAVLPTYAQIGLLAPLLLIILRMVQGTAATAEFTGSAIFLIEHAKPHRKYFNGSLTSSAYSIGCIIAALIAALATASFAPDWAWRIPFALAIIGGALVFYMRKSLVETPEFNIFSRTSQNKASFITAFKKHPRAVICTFLVAWFIAITTFGTYVYAVTYMTLYSKISLSTAIVIVSVALLVDALLEPVIAILADRWCGKTISMMGAFAITLFAFPFFHLLSSGNTIYITLGMILMSSLIAISYAPLFTLVISLFPAECRYSGFGVSCNLSMAVLGGSVPLVMTASISYSHNIYSPAVYYIGGGLVYLLTIYLEVGIKKQMKKIPKY